MKNDPEIEGAMWTPEGIKGLLEKSDQAVERALIVIYERQTADEKDHECAHWANGRGFSAHDAEFGCSMAKGCLKYGHLTPKQLPWARKMMLHYVGQLVEEANDRALKEMEARLAV